MCPVALFIALALADGALEGIQSFSDIEHRQACKGPG